MTAKNDEIIGTEKEFLDIFKTLCYSRSAWEVWADVMTAISCSLSNATDHTPERYEKREREYEKCIERLGSVEVISKLFVVITMAMEMNPDQDFLGKMYMTLELGSHWKGQFFTPYSICKCMAQISIGDDVQMEIYRRGYISVNDPACGAGATLVAAANTLKESKINYQRNVLFVGQDIDRVVGMMCYIQLSLLGCPGYVVIANTITNPLCRSILIPAEKEGQEFWFTPFFSRTEWCGRRLAESLGLSKLLFSNGRTEEKSQITVDKEKMKNYFFFYFDEQEATYGG